MMPMSFAGKSNNANLLDKLPERRDRSREGADRG